MPPIPTIRPLILLSVTAVWAGCSSGGPRKEGTKQQDTAEAGPTASPDDSGDQDPDTADSGTTEDLPAVPTIEGPCPTETLSIQNNVGLPHQWPLDQYQVEPPPLEDLGIRTDVIHAPTEWWHRFLQDMDGYEHWFQSVVTHIELIHAGDYRFRLTPIDTFGQEGEPMECDVTFMWLGAFGVELAGDPASTGGWELHVVPEGGELFEYGTDLSWCNPHIDGGDPTSLVDDLYYTTYGLDYFQLAMAHDPPPAVYTVYVYNESIEAERVDGEWGNYQVEARVFMGGELQLEARARILRGLVWEVGTIDLHTMTFTESTAPHFEPTGPTTCH